MLRQQIDQCKGVLQIVGNCYGAEPPSPTRSLAGSATPSTRRSTPGQRGKKVWYLFIDETFPMDVCEGEPAELRALQAAYRQRLQSDAHLFHPLTSKKASRLASLSCATT